MILILANNEREFDAFIRDMNIPRPICRRVKDMTDVHGLMDPDTAVVDITRPGPSMPPGDERMVRDVLNYLNHRGFTILNASQFKKLHDDLLSAQ